MAIKVCHISSVHIRYDPRLLFKECMSLKSVGYDVNLLVADGLGNEIIEGIKIFDIGLPKSRKYRILKTTKQLFKLANKLNCNILHLHDPELIPFAPKNKLLIYDAHENFIKQLLHKPYIPKIIAYPLSITFKLLEKRLLKKFAYIFAADPGTYTHFKQKFQNVCLLRNYEIYTPLPENVSRKPYLLYIGKIMPARGIWEMLDLLSFLPQNVKLILAGSFSSEKLYQQAKAHPNWARVEYYGYVTGETKKQLMQKAAIGLILLHKTPKYLESYPTKLFEYMNAGLPVVATDIPLWKEIIDNCKCGTTVNIKNPKQIAEKIIHILNNPFLAQRLGKNGNNCIKQHYNWQNEAKKLISIYNNIVKKLNLN